MMLTRELLKWSFPPLSAPSRFPLIFTLLNALLSSVHLLSALRGANSRVDLHTVDRSTGCFPLYGGSSEKQLTALCSCSALHLFALLKFDFVWEGAGADGRPLWRPLCAGLHFKLCFKSLAFLNLCFMFSLLQRPHNKASALPGKQD